jgi:hypothetical protein
MDLESSKLLAHIELWQIVHDGAGRMDDLERAIVLFSLVATCRRQPDPYWRLHAAVAGARLEPEALKAWRKEGSDDHPS